MTGLRVVMSESALVGAFASILAVPRPALVVGIDEARMCLMCTFCRECPSTIEVTEDHPCFERLRDGLCKHITTVSPAS